MPPASVHDDYEDDAYDANEDDGNDDIESPDPSDRDPDDAEDEGATVDCPHCGQEIYESAEQCPQCRQYLSTEDAPPRTSHPAWVLITTLLLLAAMIISGIFWIF